MKLVVSVFVLFFGIQLGDISMNKLRHAIAIVDVVAGFVGFFLTLVLLFLYIGLVEVDEDIKRCLQLHLVMRTA